MKNELENRIKEYIENHPCTIEFDSNNFDVADILRHNSLIEWQDDLWEFNIDYTMEVEEYSTRELYHYLCREGFEDDLIAEYKDLTEDEIINELRLNYVYADWDFETLLNDLPNITCLLTIYSNYDCTNSGDDIKNEGYLRDVYKAVKHGVRKYDYLREFEEGAYGDSLFRFAFQCDIQTYFSLKDNFKEEVTIPKGTQFGFFSNGQGCGSLFERHTYKTMKLKKQYGDTEYDDVHIVADLEQLYSMEDVYGETDFINYQEIKVK